MTKYVWKHHNLLENIVP
uniref:Uncharacterized protein n=1 Tax=Arundo donax TaxID=35708 RepID=A0A0A8YGW9_ARUDO